MARARSGDGSVYFDEAKQRWVGVVDLGRDASGKRQRRKVIASSRAEAKRRLSEMRAQRDSATLVAPNSMTVENLVRRWLDTVISGKVAPSALATYRWAGEDHLIPGLGHHRLQALTPEHVDSFLKAKAQDGYSKSTLIRLRSVLGQALRWAERRGYVARNAAALADLPVAVKAANEGRSLTPDELTAFLAVAADQRLSALLHIMATVGTRPGEATGLRWVDIDLDGCVLHVRQSRKYENGSPAIGELKTARSRRSLALPEVALRELRRHRKRSAEERLALGAEWPEEWSDLAFVSEEGTPIDPSNLRKLVGRVAREAGIGHVTPYDLRHTACSLLCDAGVPLEHVADVMGHESTRMASRVYRHVIAPSITAAVAPMDRLLANG